MESSDSAHASGTDSAAVPPGAWITAISDEESAAPEAGPLAALTFAVKDNIDVRGVPTTAGTPALEGNIPARDAGIVAVLRAAGARPVAKANLHELSLGVTSNNAHTGAVSNPYDANRVAGGSSGGSAVSVALGLVDFALGTDTGGSVRLPASYCGVIGFRPSAGRYPADGVVGLSHSRDTTGVIAANVRTLVRVDATIAGEQTVSEQSIDVHPVEGLRIGRPTWAWRDLAPEVAAAAQRAAELLGGAGAVIVDVEIDELLERSRQTATTLVTAEAVSEIRDYLAATATGQPSVEAVIAGAASPDVQAFFAHVQAHPVSSADYAQARREQTEIRAEYEAQFAAYALDLMLFPTVAMVAPLIKECVTVVHNGRDADVFSMGIRNLEISSIAGTPSISIPAPTRGGLPVGVILEAPAGSDRKLLGIAQTVVELLQAAEHGPRVENT